MAAPDPPPPPPSNVALPERQPGAERFRFGLGPLKDWFLSQLAKPPQSYGGSE